MIHAKPAVHALEAVAELAREVAAVGEAMGLPYVAASADISNPDPILGPDGRPFAGTLFRWLDPNLRYWEDRGFALRSGFVNAARVSAEPFYFADGRLASWRTVPALEAINTHEPIDAAGVASAVIAPVYLAGGAIGAVVWASPEAGPDMAGLFTARAAALHALALRFIASYADARAGSAAPPIRLTRREIQCLKWAAAGKTDGDVAEIMRIALPTVRFHITNAARKLGVMGRAQAIHRAGTLGYIGGV